jgi:hypothetical protein
VSDFPLDFARDKLAVSIPAEFYEPSANWNCEFAVAACYRVSSYADLRI